MPHLNPSRKGAVTMRSLGSPWVGFAEREGEQELCDRNTISHFCMSACVVVTKLRGDFSPEKKEHRNWHNYIVYWREEGI